VVTHLDWLGVSHGCFVFACLQALVEHLCLLSIY